MIINAGGGYYVVLAGMSRSNVNVGQFVLAGEPVASMGDGAAQPQARPRRHEWPDDDDDDSDDIFWYTDGDTVNVGDMLDQFKVVKVWG